jgi:hypothetical protein
MTPKLFFRLAAGLLAFFAIAHTFGLVGGKGGTPEVEAVVTAMHSAHFDIMGFDRTLWAFYFGFGLLLTVFLLFSAVFAWQLGGFAMGARPLVLRLSVPFLATQVAVAALSWGYFFLAPAVVSTLVVVCLTIAVWKFRKGGAVSPRAAAC